MVESTTQHADGLIFPIRRGHSRSCEVRRHSGRRHGCEREGAWNLYARERHRWWGGRRCGLLRLDRRHKAIAAPPHGMEQPWCWPPIPQGLAYCHDIRIEPLFRDDAVGP
jgi:hypothetical protein